MSERLLYPANASHPDGDVWLVDGEIVQRPAHKPEHPGPAISAEDYARAWRETHRSLT